MSTYATIAIRMDELGRIEDAELSAGLGAAAGVELAQALLSSSIAQVVEGIDTTHAVQCAHAGVHAAFLAARAYVALASNAAEDPS